MYQETSGNNSRHVDKCCTAGLGNFRILEYGAFCGVCCISLRGRDSDSVAMPDSSRFVANLTRAQRLPNIKMFFTFTLFHTLVCEYCKTQKAI